MVLSGSGLRSDEIVSSAPFQTVLSVITATEYQGF